MIAPVGGGGNKISISGPVVLVVRRRGEQTINKISAGAKSRVRIKSQQHEDSNIPRQRHARGRPLSILAAAAAAAEAVEATTMSQVQSETQQYHKYSRYRRHHHHSHNHPRRQELQPLCRARSDRVGDHPPPLNGHQHNRWWLVPSHHSTSFDSPAATRTMILVALVVVATMVPGE